MPARALTNDTPSNARVRDQVRTCVLFALPQERKLFRLKESSHLSIAVSGTGAENAARAAALLLKDATPNKTRIIICGFGGALTPQIDVGDLVLADRVINATAGLDRIDAGSFPYRRLTEEILALSTTTHKIHTGAIITASSVLITAADKQHWSLASSAAAVDMETSAAARVAEQAGIPWVAIRAITDRLDTDMPLDFNRLSGANGNVSIVKLLCNLALRPSAIPGLIRLGQASAIAGKNLGILLESIVNLPTQSSAIENAN